MGEVYRARDSRVGRDVAIKISAERFSDRFDREARAVAALNHPNICTLHDVGPNYLVMEFVDGEAPKGPLPFQTALNYARQIADALDAAHERGVVHRDLKPANIRIRTDGTVKVLDFGLAKINSPDSDASQFNLTHSPTLPMGATQVGMILGTAAYMAPEQARGKAVDKRADIWAFGVVFYEMLTGRRAFDGEDVSTILAAVIQSEPRWEGVPAEARRLLESCLEKDPRRRLRDIGDVWKLLDDAPKAQTSHARRGGSLGWIAAAALAAVAAIAFWAPSRRATTLAPQPLVRFDVDLGEDVSLAPLISPTVSSVIISPDGARLVYAASASGGPIKLFTRRLDQRTATAITGTEGATNPFFSPDGQWIGFFDGRRTAKVSVEGGAIVPLADSVIMAGASWGDDGTILVGSGITDGLKRVPPAGGAPVALTKLGNGEMFHAFPDVLPGARAALVNVYGTPPGPETVVIDVVSMSDGKRKTLVPGGVSPRYLPSGHLVYVNKSTMFAVPFDVNALELRGAAVPILDDVGHDLAAGAGQYDVSRTGTLVYRTSGGAASEVNLQWVTTSGTREPLLARPNTYLGTPRVSPDGKRIAIIIRDGSAQDVWVYDTVRDAMTRLTFGKASYTGPVWSKDGRYLAFGSIGNGMFWTRADGAGQPQPLIDDKGLVFPTSFSPDGKQLAFHRIEGTTQIWTMPIADEGGSLKGGKPARFLTTNFNDLDPAFSPDSRWIAYTSTESGRAEVYVRAFSTAPSGHEGKWQVSNNGGAFSAWSPNGRELLYFSGGQIMSVGYRVDADSFITDKPRVWATDANTPTGFDIAPDGRRVAILTPVAAKDPARQEHTIVVVQNFFDELRRRVPTGR